MNEEGYALLQSKYVAEREKVEKLEGWLKLLYYHHCDDIETDKTLQEISDYIKGGLNGKMRMYR